MSVGLLNREKYTVGFEPGMATMPGLLTVEKERAPQTLDNVMMFEMAVVESESCVTFIFIYLVMIA